MEIEIFEKKENVLFDRTEVKFYVLYEGEPTPKLLDVKSKLVALLDTKKDLIVVDNLQPKYGEPKEEGYAKVYGRESSLLDVEKESVQAVRRHEKEGQHRLRSAGFTPDHAL